MALSELISDRFNPGRGLLNTIITPKILSSRKQLDNGYTHIFPKTQQLIYSYNLGEMILTRSEWEYIFCFFNVARGKARSFLFRDDTHYKIDKQSLLTIDSANRKYAIVHQEKNSYHRIYKPDRYTIEFFNSAGDPISLSYSLDDYGVLSFVNTPPVGVQVSCEYDLWVRFNQDSLQVRFDAYDPDSGEKLFYLSGIELIEVVPWEAPPNSYGIDNLDYPPIELPEPDESVPPQEVISYEEADLVIFNTPLLYDADPDFTVYAAVNQDDCVLVADFNGDGQYEDTGFVLDESVYGVVTVAPPLLNPSIIHWDAEMEVTLKKPEMELESTTLDGFLNGANICVYGYEVFSYQQAIMVEPGKYRLKHLMRGLKGTEGFMTAQTGLSFGLGSSLNKVTLAQSLIGRNVSLKVLVEDQSIDEVNAFNSQYLGRDVQPLPIANLQAQTLDNGDIWLTWVRRPRRYGNFRDFSEIPLVENQERYVVSLRATEFSVEPNGATINGSDVRTANTLLPSYLYTVAQQTADFPNGLPSTLTLAIRQLGDFNVSDAVLIGV